MGLTSLICHGVLMHPDSILMAASFMTAVGVQDKEKYLNIFEYT